MPNGDGTATPGTGVTGATMVQDIFVSINLYRRSRGEKVTQELLAEQVATLKRFVAANP